MALPIAEIERIAGPSNVLKGPEEVYCFSYDASRLKGMPGCVVFPGTVEEVAELIRLANRDRFPVFPRGAGSGMVGGSVPSDGGLVMVLTRMNRILEIDADNMMAEVEPGVVTGELQKKVLAMGLFYPPDPASLQFSTIGGNVAMCSGGPRAVKYGVTRDYVMGLEAVLPTGSIVRTGTRTVKGVVGYDLTRLLVGSEGTLGVFTRIILRLIPAPDGTRTLMAVFPSVEGASRAVCDIVKQRIVPSTLELMDRATLEVVENHLHMGLPVRAEAMLLMEVDGPECTLDADGMRIERICLDNGASQFESARTEADRNRLWKARRAISPALGQIRPSKINEDVTVPRTRVPELIKMLHGIARKYGLIMVNFGHAGDGNIHTNILFDRKDADECARAERAVGDIFRMVLDLGGTLSGEHGVGIAKSPYFDWEVGPAGREAMWRIKQAWDPLNILNPGKMFVPNRAFFRHQT